MQENGGAKRDGDCFTVTSSKRALNVKLAKFLFEKNFKRTNYLGKRFIELFKLFQSLKREQKIAKLD